VEAALKTAVLATGRAGVLAFEGGYHGLAYAPLAACGYKLAFRAPFRGQLGAHVRFAPYPAGASARREGAVAAARAELARGDIGAVLIEPILGRGGVVRADEAAMAQIARAARDVGALVVVDEIYTGMRRTSAAHWCESARWATPPDVVCLGKALGGTLPVSACVMRAEVAAAWGDPAGEAIHTSTFLGNPLACAAALATLDVLDEPATQATLRATADALWTVALRPLLDDPRAAVASLDGAGLLAGVHLRGGLRRALAVVRAMLERGYVVLTGGVAGDCLTLTPPAVLTPEQITGFAAALREVLCAVQP
jgi:4-aminobutyrate aminotransferase/(S)-3-amino-2-methylpropionate transaminase